MIGAEASATIRAVTGAGGPTHTIDRGWYTIVTYAHDHPGGAPLGAPSYVLLPDGSYSEFHPGRQTADEAAALLQTRVVSGDSAVEQRSAPKVGG